MNENNIVKLICGSESGTAILTDSNHAVTVYHCVKYACTFPQSDIILYIVINGIGKEVNASIVDMNSQLDGENAFVYLQLKESQMNVSTVKFASCSIKPLQEIHMLGYGKNRSDVSWITLESSGRSEAIIGKKCDLQLEPRTARDKSFDGFSGSPLMDKENSYILGLISQESEVNKEILYLEGVSVRSQIKFFRKHGIQVEFLDDILNNIHTANFNTTGIYEDTTNKEGNKYLKQNSTWLKYLLAKERKVSECYSDKFGIGGAHTVAITKYGTVLAIGANTSTACNVASWRDVVKISATGISTVALKSDGTVLFTGKRIGGDTNCNNILKWNNIIAISAGDLNTVGLKKDGTVVTIGNNKYGECNTTDWTNIISISAKGKHTVGLKNDGTVIATGSNENGQCNVNTWKNIVAISAGVDFTLGLTAFGKVLATNYIGDNYHGQCEVNTWENIISISAGAFYSLGLKIDGTVIATEITGNDSEILNNGQTNVSMWNNIIAIKASGIFTVGVKTDGTFIATGNNCAHQCNIGTWRI
jgi:hypothetical protein